MIDARNYRITETLRNGVELCIRAACPDDLAGVLEAFEKLDAETVYLRFFGPKKGFSEAELDRFRHIDFDQRVTLLFPLRPGTGRRPLTPLPERIFACRFSLDKPR